MGTGVAVEVGKGVLVGVRVGSAVRVGRGVGVPVGNGGGLSLLESPLTWNRPATATSTKARARSICHEDEALSRRMRSGNTPLSLACDCLREASCVLLVRLASGDMSVCPLHAVRRLPSRFSLCQPVEKSS